MKVRLGKRGTLVIPKEIREALGLEEGDLLIVESKKRAIIVSKDETWERFHGCSISQEGNRSLISKG